MDADRRTFLKGLTVIGTAALSSSADIDAAPSRFDKTFDVVVVGGTTAGVGAAIAAGREGMRVAVIEETPTLGGLLANGLCSTDGSPEVCTGIFEDFRKRNLAYYQKNFPNDATMKNVPKARVGLRYEPSVADKLIKEMIAEIPSVHVFYGRYATKVFKQGKRVAGVATEDLEGKHPLTFAAAITIDATHEGDLLPLAGADFRLGREPRSAEEPHAGAIYMTLAGEVFGSGEGDKKLQAYALLATIKDYGPNTDKTIPKPPGYDPNNYAPEPIKDTFWYTGGALPNSKYELNENMDGTDVTEINWNYIASDRAGRRRIWEKYRDYTLGYIYFRQTVMGEKNLGLADDEFTDNHNLPYILYVREGRRLEGVHMFNERDCLRVPGFPRPPLQKDSIAVSDWHIDAHAVSRDTEGYMYLGMADPYHISAPVQAPYGIMVPKEIDGLLVPMAVSATHIGFQVLRLEPIRVAMGQAAGVAAARCVQQSIQPRQVEVKELQSTLIQQRQTLFLYTDVPPAAEHFEAIQRIGLAGIDPGYSDFSFHPDDPATLAYVAKYLFVGLKLPVKMDFTDLWKIMPSKNPKFSPHRSTQHCTPDHWATYYLMTLYNLGAFNEEVLQHMDPDAPAQRADLVRWAAAALKVEPDAHPVLAAEAQKADGTFTRAELAEFLIALMGKRDTSAS